MVLPLLLSLLSMVPMLVLADMLPTLLVLSMLPSVRLKLMLSTILMEDTVLDTVFILLVMDMVILDILLLAMVMDTVLDVPFWYCIGFFHVSQTSNRKIHGDATGGIDDGTFRVSSLAMLVCLSLVCELGYHFPISVLRKRITLMHQGSGGLIRHK